MRKSECSGPVAREAGDAVLPGSILADMSVSISINKNVCILEPWTDAIGLLHAVEQEEGRCIAKIGPLAVSLPGELAAELRPLIGERVAVLKTDSGYRFRRA